MSFYDDIMVPRLFEPWARLLLDKMHPESGQAVLDVACGPGTVTRLVAQSVGPSGRVTGCDLSLIHIFPAGESNSSTFRESAAQNR